MFAGAHHPSMKMLSRTPRVRQIAGHNGPAYMQISCRLGCQPDHLLDGARGYF